MNGSNLTYAQVMSISQNLKSYSTRMEEILNEIRTFLNKVGNDNVWSGTSAASSKAEFDKLCAKFPEFSKCIEDESMYLSTVVANYQSADKTIMNSN